MYDFSRKYLGNLYEVVLNAKMPSFLLFWPISVSVYL